MCSLSESSFGEVSWNPCCVICGAEEASALTKLCKSCSSKAYYKKNRVTILQKAKVRSREPEQLAKRAELNKAYLLKPGVQERKNLGNLIRSRKPNYRFNRAKLRSAAKGVSWSLTKQTYFALIAMECWYCDGFFQKQADQTGIGLDRIDNVKGYEPGNIISSCGACNLTRQNRWDIHQTKIMIQAVIQYNKLNNVPPPQSTIESGS